MVDRIEEDFDVQVRMLPIPTHEKYQRELREKETMEAIGHLATALFTLLNQQRPQTPPMMGVVVINKTVETTVFETDDEEEVAQTEIEEAPEVVELPPPVVVEEAAQTVIEEAPEVVELPPAMVVEEVAQTVIEEAPELIPEEATPEIAETKIDLSPKLSREQINLMIESYRQQIKLLSEAAMHERQLLRTQEQFQILKQLNNIPHRVASIEDVRAEHLSKIALLEREIQLAQKKILELQQTLQDIRG